MAVSEAQGVFYFKLLPMANDKLNGYKLTRDWFAYAFDNPELFNPTDHALYFWVMDCANANGWKSKFSFGARSAMEVLGISHYNTYKKAFDKLVQHGFITVIRKSPNHYQATIISISKNEVVSDALTNRLSSIVSDEVSDEVSATLSDTNIKLETVNNKPKTKGIGIPKKNELLLVMPNDVEPELWERYLNLNQWLKDSAPNILKIQEQITVYEYQKLSSKMKGTELAAILMKMHNWKGIEKKNVSVYLTVLNWLKRENENGKNVGTEKKLNQHGFDVSRYAP
jgi:hypothetical protein